MGIMPVAKADPLLLGQLRLPAMSCLCLSAWHCQPWWLLQATLCMLTAPLLLLFVLSLAGIITAGIVHNAVSLMPKPTQQGAVGQVRAVCCVLGVIEHMSNPVC